MSITDAVANRIAGRGVARAGRAISGGLLKVSGNLPGDWRNKMNNPSAGPSGIMEKKNRFTTNSLAYPLNVEGDPQQGHYINFLIKQQNDAQLKAVKRPPSGKQVVATIAKELNTTKDQVPVQGLAQTTDIDISAFESAPAGGPKTGGRSLQLAKQATTYIGYAISLYMPPTVSVSYGMNYSDKEIGLLAQFGAAAVKAFKEGGGDTAARLTAATSAILPGVKVGLENFMEASLDTIAPGAKALIEINEGRIIAPRMEIMFQGVGRRNFSYTFTFIPKSVQEARIVEEIVYAFKFHMHPEYMDAAAKYMRFPSTFNIEYMYLGHNNNFLNKISTCFLTKMDVEYGADRFTAYEETEGRQGKGPPPQKTKISLNFQEMEIMTKEHIHQGY